MISASGSDFHDFHLRQLPQRLSGQYGAEVAALARELPALCCRLEQSDHAYTYRPEAASIAIIAGTESSLMLEVNLQQWQLLISNRSSLEKLTISSAVELIDEALLTSRWKTVLCAMFKL